MKKETTTLDRKPNGHFLPGHSIPGGGRPPNVPKHIRNHLFSDIKVTFRQLIDVTEGKKLVINGKEHEYNHFFWLECLKLRYAYVYGKPSIQMIVDDKRGMTDEEKQARSEQIDNLALMRAKDKLKTIDVDSETK